MRILNVGSADAGGGAARVSMNLMDGYRRRGHQSWLAVGLKTLDDPDVFLLPDDDRSLFEITGYAALQRFLRTAAAKHPNRGFGSASRGLRRITHPRALTGLRQGLEDFEFPASRRLLEQLGQRPDIVQCHNLHGGYFDFRALSSISQTVPTVLTLHDSWPLTGHCSHSFDCERWRSGCGNCPDLTIYPGISRDATAENWIRKRDTFARSTLYVATPSQWLMRRVEQSMLAPYAVESRVIPNGVDLSIFRPDDMLSARRAIGVPANARVVLCPANALVGGRWTDHSTWRAAVAEIGAQEGLGDTLFVGIGHARVTPRIPGVHIHLAGYHSDQAELARYYQAADVYVHPAKADTFPGMVLEALACGTPVVATSVGGIPEQILPATASDVEGWNGCSVLSATGILVSAGNRRELASAVIALIRNDDARRRLGINASVNARERFGVDEQVDRYLAWYDALMSRGRPRSPSPGYHAT